MATAKQTKAARKNVTKAREAATSQRSIAHLPKETRSALGKQRAAVAVPGAIEQPGPHEITGHPVQGAFG
jgi:hypothetical protein